MNENIVSFNMILEKVVFAEDGSMPLIFEAGMLF